MSEEPKEKKEDSKPVRKKLEKVVSKPPKEKKKSVVKRISESMIVEDAPDVASYLLFDVVIPEFKNILLSMVNQGLERTFFGTTNDRRDRRKRGYTSYAQYYRDRDDYAPNRRNVSRHARATHDFDEIIIESRDEAEEVLERLNDMIDIYEMATVSDLYDLVGISTEFTDEAWGWTDLRRASIQRVRNGYLLNMPKPVPLDY